MCEYIKMTWSIFLHGCSMISTLQVQLLSFDHPKAIFCHPFGWKPNICYQKTVIIFLLTVLKQVEILTAAV